LGRRVFCLSQLGTRIMKRFAALTALVILAAPLSSVRADDKVVGESPYYPLKIGNTWTYNGPGNTKLINKVVAHEKVGDMMCARVETQINGETKAFEHIGITADGIYRYSLNGVKVDKPVLILKLPAKKGDEWKIDSKVGNETVTGKLTTTEEKLTVPAGMYDAMVAGGKLVSGELSVEAVNYFVKDVGIAKIKMDLMGQSIVIELDKFEPMK
jgi:hypothetical protein